MEASEIAVDYEWETGRLIVETLRAAGRSSEESPAVLVRSHGPFAWARTAQGAVEIAIALELVATMALQTVVIEAKADEIADALQARHFDRKHGPSAYYGQPTDDVGSLR